MSIYLRVLRLGWEVFVYKTYILVILSIYNYLCEIYYIFKKESKYMIGIKREKNAMNDKEKIWADNNINRQRT